MAVDFKSFAKLKSYYQILIVAGVCGALLGAVWYAFLSPMQEDITARTEALAVLQANINKSLLQKASLSKFKAAAIELEASLEELKSVLPQDKETDVVLRQVQSSARSSGLRILSVISRPIVDHEVYTEWPLQMQVVGTYHNIGAFLDKIRQLPRIVNIASLKIVSRAPEGDAGASETVNATYTATTFVYREETPTPEAGAQAKR